MGPLKKSHCKVKAVQVKAKIDDGKINFIRSRTKHLLFLKHTVYMNSFQCGFMKTVSRSNALAAEAKITRKGAEE